MRVCKYSCGVIMFCCAPADHASTIMKKRFKLVLYKFTLFTPFVDVRNLKNRYKHALAKLFFTQAGILSKKNPYFDGICLQKKNSLRIQNFAHSNSLLVGMSVLISTSKERVLLFQMYLLKVVCVAPLCISVILAT